MEITIPKGTRQHRVFEIAMEFWSNFLEYGYNAERYRDGTNFCHFVRMIIVYAPVAILTNLLMWIAAVACLVLLPIHLFGGWGYITTVMSLAVLVAAICGIRKLAKEHRKKHWESVLLSIPEAKPSRGPSFVDLAVQYVAAKKAKICPPVVFTDTKEVGHVSSH
jgi:hypothetical protein